MIIASDVTTLKQRGKYNGFIGASVAVGNGLGPLIGGIVTEKASWKWCLWFIVPVIILTMILLGLAIPKSRVPGGSWAKIKMIDWLGLIISVAAVLLLLVSLYCLAPKSARQTVLAQQSSFSLTGVSDANFRGWCSFCMEQPPRRGYALCWCCHDIYIPPSRVALCKVANNAP